MFWPLVNMAGYRTLRTLVN